MKRLICMILVGTAFVTAIPATRVWAQSPDPVNGRWSLNVAKSTFSSSTPKSEKRTYEVSGDSVKQTTDRVDSQGNVSVLRT